MKQVSLQSTQPTPPSRSASLKRRSRNRDSDLGTLSKANSVPASTTTSISNGTLKTDDNDDLVYVVKKDIISRRVPMDSNTELVPFHELPGEAQQRPTDTLTWAQQTPEFLYLETIVPPQCQVCLARLEERAALASTPGPSVVLEAPVIERTSEVEPTAPDIIPQAPTVSAAPALYSPSPYEEGNTPFVDSLDQLSVGEKPYLNRQYTSNTVSNAATPALLIPGNYLWGS